MQDDGDPTVFISWPSAPLTEWLVRKSLGALNIPLSLSSTLPEHFSRLVQWSAYDALDHELAHSQPVNVIMSSYTIRKSLIRKHFLSRCVQSYFTKHDSSILKMAVPRTWDIDISFVDELDEMWADELWDLGEELDISANWWILKPGMADRGMGIRLFNSKDALRKIFEDFESCSEDDEGDSDGVVTSQLRHFVIQEYISNPLLLDPKQVQRKGYLHLNESGTPRGHKFHLRAYCISSGALTLYLCSHVLALFSAVPYFPPVEGDTVDLKPHLTNTSLQMHGGEESVFLLEELVGSYVLSDPQLQDDVGQGEVKLATEDIAFILDQIADILAEIFKAALENPVHFQPIPNAFELYGVDFLVTDVRHSGPSSGAKPSLQVKLLEINAEPAIELTGPRLTWILEELFVAIGKVCVEPFLSNGCGKGELDSWDLGETRHGLRKCLDLKVWGLDAR